MSHFKTYKKIITSSNDFNEVWNQLNKAIKDNNDCKLSNKLLQFEPINDKCNGIVINTKSNIEFDIRHNFKSGGYLIRMTDQSNKDKPKSSIVVCR